MLGYVVGAIMVSAWAGATTSDSLAVVLIGSISLWIGFVGAPWGASRAQGTGSVVRDFEVTFRRSDLPVGVVTGVGLQLVVLPLVYGLLQLVTGPLDVEGPARDLADRAAGPLAWTAFAVVVGVGAPLAEELFFRGLLRTSIEARTGRRVAIVASSAIFAATHFQPVQFVGLFVAAWTWAVLADRSGRLGPAIVSHVAFNLTTVATLMLTS